MWQAAKREGITIAHLCHSEDLVPDGNACAADPAARVDEAGHSIVFVDRFPTTDGKATLVSTTFRPGPEQPDPRYPFVLTTGRVLEHWHAGAMTRHSSVLDAIAPEAFATLHPVDADCLGVGEGTGIELASRHGAVRARARISPEVRAGQVFIPFAFWEAAANKLTGDAVDDVAKIAGFKATAISVSKC